MSAIKCLVSGIVDYAGLFPPAKLPLDEVILNYQEYLDGEFAWMLARLVLPVAKVAELEEHPTFKNSNHTWRISALVPPVSDLDAFNAAMKTIVEFNDRNRENSKAKIDNIEIRTPTVEAVSETASRIPDDIVAFLEIPHQEDPASHVDTVAAAGKANLFAKIRTGGVTEDLIPPPDQVARFIATCASKNVGMKATAGLHHPIRGAFRLTYEENADNGTMYGFINVFAAAAFAYSEQHGLEFLESVLTETDGTQFEFSDEGLSFGNHSVSKDQLAEIRRTRLATFGSCSFTEPTEELAEFGWL